MNDAAIVDLYWARDEEALVQTQRKYGAYLHIIAHNVLGSKADADECVNDAYLGAWNAIPSARPTLLKAFVGKIVRNVSLKRWRAATAQKRGGGEVALSLDELAECVASTESVEQDVLHHAETDELVRSLNTFLEGLSRENRQVFLCRYWYFDTISAIAERFNFTESKVKMTLKRTRDALATYLQQEGIVV